MAEIINISDIDKYSKAYDKAIDRALIASAYEVREKAIEHLLSIYPNTEKFQNGIYVGVLRDKKITISSLGNKSYDDFKARFFVGGTKERTDLGGYRKTKNGIQYVKYKKPMSKGSITPTHSLSVAFENQKQSIHAFFNNLIIEENK